MKKFLSNIIALLIALLPLGAMAAEGDANLGRKIRDEQGDYLSGCFVQGDTLYVYGYRNLYAYQRGDADFTPLPLTMAEGEDNESVNMQNLFSNGEKIFGLFTVYDTADGNYVLKRLELREAEIADGKVSFGEPREMDVSDISYSEGKYTYLMQINCIRAMGDTAYLSMYDNQGERALYALNLESGTGSFIEVDEPSQIVPYKDGQLLIDSVQYTEMAVMHSFYAYDPESESVTSLREPFSWEGNFEGLAYSAESDRTFFVSSGYVMACDGFDVENAQPVAEMSMTGYSDIGANLLPGDYYAYCNYEICCVRGTDPEKLPETRLTVYNNGYSEAVTNAYYDFTNVHNDVAVILSQNYIEDSKIIESMMNRDSSVDVYMLSVSRQAYDALFERGYMAELDSDVIRDAVGKMYPGVRSVLERDGEVVAVPTGLYGWCMGVNLEGFEKIGVSKEEIPTDWVGFLSFLESLSDKLPEDGKVRIFEDYLTQGNAKETLLGQALTSYQNYMTATGGTSYDTPELRAVLEKIMSMDYAAMGLKESEEDEEGMASGMVTYVVGGSDSERSYTLINTGVGCTLGNFYSEDTPWLLSFVEGEAPQLPLDMSVAFINPFSEHVELAQEYLEKLVQNMDVSTRYNVSDQESEPLRSSYYEESKKEYEKQVDELKAQIEKAEPVDKPALEESLKALEASQEDMEKYSWEVSQESLDWYRANDEYIMVTRYNCMYSDDSGEINDLAYQLFSDKIDVATFLKNVDQKVRMMILEGN